MTRTLILDHDQTRQAITFDALISGVRSALIATGRGEDSTPPRIAAFAPRGLLGAMPGYIPGMGLAAKLITVFSATEVGGHSSHQGIVALFDEQTGEISAVMNGEAVTALRTAASATVAFQALAPPSVKRIAVIGAGTQARSQLEFLDHLGLGAHVTVASRTPERASTLAAGFGFASSDSIEDAVVGADAIFCCTDATNPVIRDEWLSAGVHVSSIGGFRGPELAPATIGRGSVYVEWSGAGNPLPAGAHELQGVAAERITLIGRVLSGDAPGRQPEDLTVYKSTGYAGLDVAAAAVAFEKARTAGIGTWIDL